MGLGNGLLIVAILGGGFWAYKQGMFSQIELGAKPAVGGPSVTPASLATMTPQHSLLNDNSRYVSGWSDKHPDLTAAIMWQESRGNPAAVSSAGALGLMQVMPDTATWLHDDKGYQVIDPTRDNLLTAGGSIYFGTAYLEYLHSIRGDRSLEWFIRAYNGGPAGASKYLGGGKNTENDGFYKAVLGRFEANTGEA